MSEITERIAKSIERHRNLELQISAINPAIARSDVKYDNSEMQFWIINKQDFGGYKNKINITGATIGTVPGPRTTVRGDGPTIYKNTILGEVLIRNYSGKHTNITPSGKMEFEIYNLATYIPSKSEIASDIVIQISTDDKRYQYRSLKDILKLAKGIQDEIDLLRKEQKSVSESQAEELLIRIKEKEREKIETLKKAQNFIRKNAELRYQPVLDPWQEEAKRSKIFDGTIVIDGGPGTGKTTCLIQRLKFLIDESIEEYIPNLSKAQKTKLFDQNKSWIFFSPSQLLALYLKNNMVQEGLDASNEKVKVWSDHKRDLIKKYKLVNTDTRRPFLFYNDKENNILLKSNATKIKRVIDGFWEFFIDHHLKKLNKLVQIDISVFSWKNTGISIQNYLQNIDVGFNIDKAILTFIKLNQIYKTDIDSIVSEYKRVIEKNVSRLQIEIIKNERRKNGLEELLKSWESDSATIEEDDGESNIEEEQFEEEEEDETFDFEKVLFNKLKALKRKFELLKIDKTVKLTSKDKQLLELVPEIEDSNEESNAIGQLAYFRKHIERACKGLEFNMLREIPLIYKKYRRAVLRNKDNDWDSELLNKLISKDNNKRLHPNEQGILIYIINSLIKRLYKASKFEYNNANHSYIQAFKENTKPVIGIDEASDFHIIDLLAMHSLSDPDIASVTYSGDIMQRMRKEGISNWNDLTKFIPSFEIKELLISYRQSPTLLELGQRIYLESLGKESDYISVMDKDEMEPAPLLYKSKDEESKIKWIAKRIHEIYKAYGDSIPSIAIFLPDGNQLESFAENLAIYDELADFGIHVKASRNGDILGDKNTVRVFSIEHIKGLEFEAVFFYNLDKIQGLKIDKSLLNRYLYVGLSRATFYLAVILENELEDSLSYLNEYISDEKDWKL